MNSGMKTIIFCTKDYAVCHVTGIKHNHKSCFYFIEKVCVMTYVQHSTAHRLSFCVTQRAGTLVVEDLYV